MIRRSLVVGALLLAVPSTVSADVELKWAAEGFYRTRGVFLTNMAAADATRLPYPVNGEDFVIPEIRRTSYLAHSLRVMPRVSLGDLVTLHAQIDGFRDVLWGDNNGLFAAPLFATDATNQSLFGTDQNRFFGQQENLSLNLTRAWIDFKVPVGRVRVGRMASHWGMGLLANGGGTGNVDPTTPAGEPERKAFDYFFDDDFGDNHFGSTTDRILFITKPLSIYKSIAGHSNVDSKLVMGYAYDKISEAPWLPNEPFERRFRPFGQQGFISRGNNDDVTEHVGLILWNDPEINILRYTDDLRIGMYSVFRHQSEGSTEPSNLDPNANCGEFEGEIQPCEDTGSLVMIFDFWYRLRLGPYYSEAEVLTIRGNTFGGIPFPSANRKRKAQINSGAFRAGYLTDSWDGVFEVGYASGDDQLEDENFKQRPMHPDYNVGLILFEEILRELSARTYGPPFFSEANPNGAIGFFSNGGVINSTYIHPKGRYRIELDRGTQVEVIGALLFAWVDELAQGVGMFGPGVNKYLGTEVDLAIKAWFHDRRMNFTLESGLLFFGDALKSVYPLADTSFTLQSRIAFMF
ncbi:MAG: hypothetical protein KJO07_13735 [Deltaproteobacteria bacterium]|nr:hypothetical protein [Deltaproteobacteria bacterium]